MFIYVLLGLGVVFVAGYNQKIFPSALKNKTAYYIYLPGVVEAFVLLITNSGFLVPIVYSSLLITHLGNYLKSGVSGPDTEWLKKQIYLRIGIIITIYSFIAIWLYLPNK